RAALQADEEIDDEYQLRQPQPPRAPGDEDIQRLHSAPVRVDGRVVQPPRQSGHALEEHRHEDQVDADEADPEVDLAQRGVELLAGGFRVPIVDARKKGEAAARRNYILE